MICKMKQLIKDNKFVLLSGAVSLFIILFVYFCYSIIPFGDRTVYRMDLYHQYGPLFSEMYDRLISGESFLFSWNSGMGSSFIGNFFNYLSSPFSFLILLFGHKNTFEAIAAMIACKAVFSAMSMSYYLKKSHKTNDAILIAFGVMYAFSGYFIAYYWNVMWIDAMYLLPFVVLGIERIIDSGKCTTYIVSLALSILFNYYIGYMICIFSCAYFLYYYYCSLDKFDKRHKILKYKEGKKRRIKNSFLLNSGIRFALSSLVAAAMIVGVLLPVAYVLGSSSATSGTFPTDFKGHFDFFDFIANHIASVEPTIRSSGEDVLPNVYCGMFTIILIPIFLLSKKITITEKVGSVVFLFFMYCSFNVNVLNYIWHGFHYPNDLPYRQSFMYSFILLIMAHKAFTHILEFNIKHIIGSGIVVVSFIVAVMWFGSKNVSNLSIILTTIFAIMIIVVLCIIVNNKVQIQALTILLACIVISETIVCNTRHYVANQSKESYVTDYDDFKVLQSKIDSKDEDLFYRTELSYLRARMDPSWYDYDGVSVFSSMAYEHVAKFQKAIGLFGNNINSYTYNPNSPLFNSMFSIKYVYDRKQLINESDYYSFVDRNGVYNVYENKYHLNLAYPVSNELMNWDAALYSDPVKAQEEFLYFATGIDGLYERNYDYQIQFDNIHSFGIHNKVLGTLPVTRKDESIKDAKLTVEITAKENKNIYVYIHSRNVDEVKIKSNKISTSLDVKDGFIFDLGYYNTGDVVTVTLPLKESENSANIDFLVFTVDNEKFVEGYEKLKSGQIELTEFKETKISGTFVAEKDEILFTSIPYDKGWNVYIDGEKVADEDIIKISNAMLGVKINEGKHDITFEYSIPNSNVACFISLGFISLFIIVLIMNKKKLFIFKNAKPNVWERSEGELPEEFNENVIEKTPEEGQIENPDDNSEN